VASARWAAHPTASHATLFRPTITGTPQVGQTLTADHGEWSGAPSGYLYRWAEFPPGKGEVGLQLEPFGVTFVLTGAQLGKVMTVQVFAKNGVGESWYVESLKTDIVKA
jgi:hypothetical protein